MSKSYFPGEEGKEREEQPQEEENQEKGAEETEYGMCQSRCVKIWGTKKTIMKIMLNCFGLF